MSNKNKNKAKKSGKSTLTLIQEILGVIGGIVGSVMVIYGFIKTFRDDVGGFSWLLFLGGAIWLYVIWQMFQRQKVYAYIFLAVTVVGGVAGWAGWKGQIQAKEDKVIVVIAKFDGPEDEYGLRDEMIEQLRETTKSYSDTEIIAAEELVTVAQGSEYARELGDKYQADLVIWAWFKPTEDPNITIHIENLDKAQIEVLQESEIYQPQATLADLESFEIQRQIGSETSTLVSFLTGLFFFKSGDYETALQRFNKIESAKDTSTYIDLEALYLKIGSSHYYLGQLEQSVQALTKAIAINPNSIDAYNNRGIDYAHLHKYELAINDFEKTIELDKNYGTGYYNLGFVNQFSGQYEQAIPYFSKAIELDPTDFAAYSNRGTSYVIIGSYQEALTDYDMAIKLQPNWAIFYFNRGNLYKKIGKNAESEADYAKFNELTGQDAP